MVFLVNLAFKFYSDISIPITSQFLHLNVYLMQNMKKDPIEMPVSLFFLQH